MINLDTLTSTSENFEKLREFAKKQRKALEQSRMAADTAGRRIEELRGTLKAAEQTHAKEVVDWKGKVALRDSQIEDLRAAQTRDAAALRETQEAAAQQDSARVREIETAQIAIATVTRDRNALARRLAGIETEDRDLKTVRKRLAERSEQVRELEARLRAVEEGTLRRQIEDLTKRLQTTEDALRAGQSEIDTAKRFLAELQVGNRLAPGSTCP